MTDQAPAVQVVFNVPVGRSFTYAVAAGQNAPVGVRVRAPFGRRSLTGAVIAAATPDSAAGFELKLLERVVDERPLFGALELELAQWIADFYLCSLGEALFTMLPGGKRESEGEGVGEAPGGRSAPTLSEHQARAVDRILQGSEKAYYLYGVTGSGKTEVFLRVAKEILARGLGVIYLVPEISLVHQVARVFSAELGPRVVEMHSGLPPARRLRAWTAVREGQADLVIGARSAVFAPLPRPGLIIIDEEHEGSYKAGSTPRYHARQVAFHRAAAQGCRLLMGSATPSVEALENMSQGAIVRLDLPERVAGGGMPRIEVVDMKAETGILSRKLLEALKQTVAEGRQAVLFLNRRGFSYFFYCRSCGFEMKCRRCSVALTYHKARNRMVCHYCGASAAPVAVCPECGSLDVGPSGFGTEKVEEELTAIFPDLRVARLDTDTARRRNVLKSVLARFRDRELDVLVGTQMVAKGLDFPGVKLVGVVSADTGLQLPDFRALERTFALIVQVSGRAGRITPDGRVIVQTLRPETGVIQRAALGQAEQFYREELALRRQLRFPPFYRLVRLLVRGRDRERVAAAAAAAAQTAAAAAPDVDVLGPVECPLALIAGNYRQHVLLRAQRLGPVHAAAAAVQRSWRKAAGVYLEIDVDPVSLL
jgi:primosomal protein N' (replication factor Y) (superfamily II helicase)